jgi:hypothetical protein
VSSRNTVLRAVDQVSLAAWFGGSLMGALALPRAASSSDRPLQAEGEGWQAWRPVQTAAVVAQLASGAALTYTNKGRVLTQQGVPGTSAVRTALTGAALAATVVAARSGRRAGTAAREGGTGGNGASGEAPAEGDAATESALVSTRVAQWAVPVLTGAMLVLDARMGEQQRPMQVALGVVNRVVPPPVASRIPAA